MTDLFIELWFEWLDMWGIMPLPKKREASIPQVWPL
jgi:hypothetical protein